tara:strand:- start:4705 stop:5370 length:666 start_codon:yes stop_codon:yes gene_type:complete
MLKEIFSLFKSDSLYQVALDECYEMLDLDYKMIDSSISSLRKNNTDEYPLNIYSMDKKINEFERDVRRKIMTHLSLGNQEDLAPGMVLVNIVSDIERIGDYAKNIYDLAIQYPGTLKCGVNENNVTKIEISAKEFLSETIISFKNHDIELARKLMVDYKTDIASVSNEITSKIVEGNTDDLSAPQSSALCLYLRYLKRVSAHSRNLVSSVVNPFERIGYAE